jgi:hypothetical protein
MEAKKREAVLEKITMQMLRMYPNAQREEVQALCKHNLHAKTSIST